MSTVNKATPAAPVAAAAPVTPAAPAAASAENQGIGQSPTLMEIMKKGTQAAPPVEESKEKKEEKKEEAGKPAEVAPGEKAGEKKPEAKKEEKVTEEKKEAGSVKRVIKRAKGYEEVPGVTQATDKLAAAADKLAEAASRVGQAATPKVDEKPKVELAPADEKRIKVFEAMAELDKDRFKDLAANARKFITEHPVRKEKFETKFQKDWARNNPDSKFDSTEERDEAYRDAFHTTFAKEEAKVRKDLSIDYSDEDYAEGVVHLRTADVRAENQKLKEEQTRLANIEKERNVRAEAQQFTSAAVADLSTNIKGKLGDEYDGLLDDSGKLDEAALAKVPHGEEVAEVVKDALSTAAQHSRAMADAIIVVANGGRSPLDTYVFGLLDDYEKTMAAKPEEERMEDGKLFATRADWPKLSEKEREKRWFMTPDHLVAHCNDRILETASAKIKSEQARVTKIEESLMKRYKIDPKSKAEKPDEKKEEAAGAGGSGGNGKPTTVTATNPKPGAGGSAAGGPSWLQSMAGKTIINGNAV